MLCPKCGYNSFEYNDNCPKCKQDLKPTRGQLLLTAPKPGPVNFFSLLGFEDPTQTAPPSPENHGRA
ncbi:MAG: hypothetical protein LBT38_11715 [Deltaproteobacteria bacterium]|jgi:hypothetical protein|nr:hypothetical protein [Deltaproteobacteria bacterium]